MENRKSIRRARWKNGSLFSLHGSSAATRSSRTLRFCGLFRIAVVSRFAVEKGVDYNATTSEIIESTDAGEIARVKRAFLNGASESDADADLKATAGECTCRPLTESPRMKYSSGLTLILNQSRG